MCVCVCANEVSAKGEEEVTKEENAENFHNPLEVRRQCLVTLSVSWNCKQKENKERLDGTQANKEKAHP